MSITIKQGDTGVTVTATLKSDGSAYNLTGSSAVIRLHPRPSGTTVEQACTVDADPTTGKVSVVLASTVTAGHYDVEFRVTTPGLTTLTFPNAGYEAVELLARL